MSPYIREREGAWRLWFHRDLWTREIWDTVRQRIAQERPSKHPHTAEIRTAGGAQPLFIKIFFPRSAPGSFKDCFRRSKAVRALLLSESLARYGFHVPVAAGAGEERYAANLRRSFLVTLPVIGCPLPHFLHDRLADRLRDASLRRKRETVARLAREVRKLHDLGFVHGDLVPGNIFIVFDAQGTERFCFMDNDRTRRYPLWLRPRLRLWQRNLVQLNRFPLAGISLQDRMRFFHAYVNLVKLGPAERKLVRWLEQKTRQRRRECDAVDNTGSFRRLMRWDSAGSEPGSPK
jgi:hypothetical protein